MNLLVCFKIVYDLDSVMQGDWDNASIKTFDISYANKIIDCYDEAAIECALGLRDAMREQNKEVFITALTLGSENNETLYKNMFAVGISRIIQVMPKSNMQFSPYANASAIVKAVKDIKFDAVIMGCQSSISGNDQTQYAVARILDIPCINHVTKMSLQNGKVCVEFETETGIRKATVNTPAVYAIGNTSRPYLRVGTLREKLSVSERKAEIIKLNTDEVTDKLPSDLKLIKLLSEKRKRKCNFIDGATARDKALELYNLYLKDVEL